MVQHLGRNSSDHSPLLLFVKTHLDNKLRLFRFLNAWTIHKDLLGVIRECWSQPGNGFPLQALVAKLRGVKQALKQWSKLSFEDIFQIARSAEREMLEVKTRYDMDPTDDLRRELHHAQARLRYALMVEEGFWRQKTRVK